MSVQQGHVADDPAALWIRAADKSVERCSDSGNVLASFRETLPPPPIQRQSHRRNGTTTMQLTFGDAEYNGKRKRTRREVFLAEMDQVVPWKGLLALIEPHYPKSGQPGRQPYRLETMLRIHFLQQWYALSDPSAEEA
ncbi:transposase, partial [Xanthomonas oryzae pv. oryzae]